jgi:hypothetical protein
MADTSTKITNFPDSGSPERVAYDLMKYLQALVTEKSSVEARKNAFLDLYAECLHATRGYRNSNKKYGDAAKA